MPRLALVLLFTGLLAGCGPEPCVPPGWDEDTVQTAFVRRHLESALRPALVDMRALTWGHVSDLAHGAGVGEQPDTTGVAVVVWLQTDAQDYLVTYVSMEKGEHGWGEIQAMRAFSEPIRRIDVRRFIEAHYLVGERLAPDAVRIDLPEGQQLTLADHVCEAAFAAVIENGHLGPPSGLGGFKQNPITVHTYDPVPLGERLFAAQACDVCHSIDETRKVGAGMGGLWKQPRCIEGQDEPVLADADYLRRAISDPSSEVVCGYPAIMPAYPHLDGVQTDALLAYIRSLAAPADTLDAGLSRGTGW